MFTAVRRALTVICSAQKSGNAGRILNLTAALICGIIRNKDCHLSHAADEMPGNALPASNEKRLYRLMKNEKFDLETYFLPFAQALLSCLSKETLVLAIDGSTVGRGCMALVVSVVYKQRALPIAWLVVKGKKGHLPEADHIKILQQVHPLIPKGARVVLVGDGEFDGINLQAVINNWKWHYACRTASNITLYWEDEPFEFQDMGDRTAPGEIFDGPGCKFTQKKYGPVLALCWWRKDCKEPIYLVSNLSSAEEACRFYSKRFRIETFFSDAKSRGFNLHKSHISDPDRISRLMIGACLAYYWIVYLGAVAMSGDWWKKIRRSNRCDLSLFQLGFSLLKYFLKNGFDIPYRFWCLPESTNT